MLLKINYLYNLHDARYCASKGIQFLTFFVGRSPNQPKLPLSMIWEIVDWLEGSMICLDTGKDKDTFLQLCDILQPHPNLFLQISSQIFTPAFLERYPQLFLRLNSSLPNEFINGITDNKNLFLEIPLSSLSFIDSFPILKNRCFILLHTMPENITNLLRSYSNVTLEKFLFNEMELNYEELDRFVESLIYS